MKKTKAMLSAKIREEEKDIEGIVKVVYPNSVQGAPQKYYPLLGNQQLRGTPGVFEKLLSKEKP